MKEPQAERQEKAAGDQRKRMKGEVRKGEPRRRNPQEWNEERNPSNRQQEDLQRPFLTLRNLDRPAALAVRRANRAPGQCWQREPPLSRTRIQSRNVIASSLVSFVSLWWVSVEYRAETQ